MPSPIAHAAVALLAPPLIPADDRARLSRPRAIALYGLVTLTLCIPDIDFAIPLLADVTKHQAHGAGTHSLFAGLIGGAIFAGLARLVVRNLWSFTRLTVVGTACYWLHLVMDVVTNGRGIMLLWPITSERIRTPFSLFTGIHWSDPSRWDLHARTAANEGLFVLVVLGVATALLLRRRTAAIGGVG